MHERRLPVDEPFSGLVRLFMLGLPLAAAEIEVALGSIDRSTLERGGWLEPVDGGLRATLKLVPHGDLLLASDRDADGPTGADWVAGLHPPSVTLAKLTVRQPVGRALDVATGNGIQALLASRHAEAVVATDLNARALDFASLNAKLNGVSNIEFRQGSYFEPAAGDRFHLVTCNPPYVISPEARYAFRDSGLPGDTVSRQVVRAAPEVLCEGGFAQILISWAHAPGDWSSPLEGWVEGCGCDAWLLYFGSDDPVTHAAEWLRPLAHEDSHAYRESLARWLDYLAELGIEAIAHGAVILRRRTTRENWIRKDTVSLERLEQASEHILRVFANEDHLQGLASEHQLLDACLAPADRHRLEQTLTCHDGKTELESTVLSLDDGLALRTRLDEHTAALLPLLDGRRPLQQALRQRSRELELAAEDAERYETAALPAIRRLLQLGFLTHRGKPPPADDTSAAEGALAKTDAEALSSAEATSPAAADDRGGRGDAVAESETR